MVASLASTGCAAVLAASGKDLRDLKTREDVHATFGNPVATGEMEGLQYEEFVTRKKISDSSLAGPGAMAYVITVGLYDLIGFPYQLYVVGRHTLLGQVLRFSYSADGKVVGVYDDVPPRSFKQYRPRQCGDPGRAPTATFCRLV